MMAVHPSTEIVLGSGAHTIPAALVRRGHEVMSIYANRTSKAWVDQVEKKFSEGLLEVSTQMGTIRVSPGTFFASDRNGMRWKPGSALQVGDAVKEVSEGVVFVESVVAIGEIGGSHEVFELLIDGQGHNFIANGFIIRQ